jgi:Ribbon-helix-helix protein, copG family
MPRQRRERQRTGGRRERAKVREKTPMKVTTIALEEDMLLKLRHLAIDEKTNLRELLRRMIAECLARRERR